MKTHDIISAQIIDGYFIYTYSNGRRIIKTVVKIERMA